MNESERVGEPEDFSAKRFRDYNQAGSGLQKKLLRRWKIRSVCLEFCRENFYIFRGVTVHWSIIFYAQVVLPSRHNSSEEKNIWWKASNTNAFFQYVQQCHENQHDKRRRIWLSHQEKGEKILKNGNIQQTIVGEGYQVWCRGVDFCTVF